MAEEFEICMGIRLDADYGIVYDRESAEIAIGYAERFLDKALSILGMELENGEKAKTE